MQKIKARYDAFSDAILAIIITIVVLELPVQVVHGQLMWGQLFSAIVIYITSFMFVANIWFQRATIFNEVEEIGNQTMVRDLILIMFLSLLPTFTKIMFSDTIFLTILAYGILYVIIITLVRFVARDVLHGKYQDKSEMAKVYRAIYGDNNWDQFGIILAIIVIGYFLPQIAVLFFILIPTRNFISNANKQQAFEDIEHLEPNGRQAYLDMDNKNRIEFAKMTRSFIQDLSNQPEADSQQIVDRYSKEISERFGISAKDWQRWSTHLIERAQHARRRQERQELHNNRKNKNTLKK